MRAVATHLLHFGAAESCGKCFPCRIGLQRAHAMFDERRAGRPRASSSSCSRRSSSAACAPTAAACRRRSAACSRTSPRSWGCDVITLDDRRRGGHRPARDDDPRGRARHGRRSRRSASTSARRPFGACRVCLVGIEGAPGPVASCTTVVPRGHEGRHAGRDRAPRRHRGRRARALRAPGSRPPSTPSWRRSRACSTSASRAGPARSTSVAARRAPPVPRLPARAVHLVRALRARVRRGPGHVRADRHRPRLRRQHRRRAGRGLPRLRLRLVRRLRRHLPDRRHHRDLPATPDDLNREVTPCSTATVTTTCGYCGVGCRLEAHARDGKVASISPALDGPANEGHTCLKGRFAHQFSRRRDRLTAPLIREDGEFRLATLGGGDPPHHDRADADQGRPRPGRDRRPRLLARDQRGLLRDAAPDARRDRHQQHRQLLARLPLADVVRAAQVVRPVAARPARSATSTTPTRRS